jgi:hypothetical protein
MEQRAAILDGTRIAALLVPIIELEYDSAPPPNNGEEEPKPPSTWSTCGKHLCFTRTRLLVLSICQPMRHASWNLYTKREVNKAAFRSSVALPSCKAHAPHDHFTTTLQSGTARTPFSSQEHASQRHTHEQETA